MNWIRPFAVVVLLAGSWRPALAGDAPETDQVLTLEDGAVTANLTKKWVRIPAEVCLPPDRMAYIEFFAFFTGGGKDHESAFRVLCLPENVQLALISLGLRTSSDQVAEVGDKRKPTGDAVTLEVEWKDEAGKVQRRRAEEFLSDTKQKKPMEKTNWIFTGGQYQDVVDPATGRTKRIWRGVYTKLMAAVYRDPEAILNSPLETGSDDEIYRIDGEKMPKEGTKVTLIVSVPEKEEAKKPETQPIPAPPAGTVVPDVGGPEPAKGN